METFQDIFGMSLFPHIYAVPLSIVLGVAIGYYLRGRIEDGDQRLPPKPQA